MSEKPVTEQVSEAASNAAQTVSDTLTGKSNEDKVKDGAS